ncbi:GNAT family protein [Nakamurella sp. A5-74]|uniref:GNAT family protein n=1 Tax=Nakamurella sp. A5-74 TaxID=3158264 RepID=A0AAU8DKD4_9ACTN
MTDPVPIVLRPWQTTDAAALLAIFAASDDLSTQYPSPVTSLAEADACLEKMLGWDATRKNAAIVPGPDLDGDPVGNIAVTGVEFRHGTGWVSYFSSGDVRGRGHIGRSAAALTNWALDPAGLGLERLELGHRLNNPASGVIALRAGFVREGTERAKLRYGDERFDVATYGRLRSDPAPRPSGVLLYLP